MSETHDNQEAPASWSAEAQLEAELGLAEAARRLLQFSNSVALDYQDGNATVRERIIGEGDRDVMRRLSAHWRIQLGWIQNPAEAERELQSVGPVTCAIIIARSVEDLRRRGGYETPARPSPEAAWIAAHSSQPPTRGWDASIYEAIASWPDRRRLAEEITKAAAETQVSRREHMADGGRVSAVRALTALIAVAESATAWGVRQDPVD